MLKAERKTLLAFVGGFGREFVGRRAKLNEELWKERSQESMRFLRVRKQEEKDIKEKHNKKVAKREFLDCVLVSG